MRKQYWVEVESEHPELEKEFVIEIPGVHRRPPFLGGESGVNMWGLAGREETMNSGIISPRKKSWKERGW